MSSRLNRFQLGKKPKEPDKKPGTDILSGLDIPIDKAKIWLIDPCARPC